MTRKKAVELFTNNWNDFIKTLISLERFWKILVKLKEKYEISTEDFPDKSQRILTKVNFRSKFSVGTVRFIEFIERFGLLEDCFIERIKKKETEEVENGRRRSEGNNNSN